VIRRSALLLLFSLAFALQGWSQTRLHLYPDDNLVWRDMIAHVADGLVRMGNSWSGEILYTMNADNMWDETRVFRGYSTSSLDIAFTVRDEGKLYLGDSSFTDAILYTFKDGQIFVGDSTFPLDVAYTLREESRKFAGRGDDPIWGVYREDSRSWSDRVCVLEGPLDASFVLILLSAAGFL
jgi:hypothetical protein